MIFLLNNIVFLLLFEAEAEVLQDLQHLSATAVHPLLRLRELCGAF